MENEIATLISNVGFPIAAFCAMFYMCNTTIKENTKAIVDLKLFLKDFDEKGRKDATN